MRLNSHPSNPATIIQQVPSLEYLPAYPLYLKIDDLRTPQIVLEYLGSKWGHFREAGEGPLDVVSRNDLLAQAKKLLVDPNLSTRITMLRALHAVDGVNVRLLEAGLLHEQPDPLLLRLAQNLFGRFAGDPVV